MSRRELYSFIHQLIVEYGTEEDGDFDLRLCHIPSPERRELTSLYIQYSDSYLDIFDRDSVKDSLTTMLATNSAADKESFAETVCFAACVSYWDVLQDLIDDIADDYQPDRIEDIAC